MAGVWVKAGGAWIKAAAGPSGIGTFCWVKVNGTWVLSEGGTTRAPSFYVKGDGAWVPEEQGL